MPHEEVLRSRLDALRDHLRRLIGPPVGRGGGAGAFVPPPVAPPSGGLGLLWFNTFIAPLILPPFAPFLFEGVDNYATGTMMVMPFPARVRGLAVLVSFGSLTQPAQVHLVVDQVPVVSVQINPGQIGVIMPPAPFSMTVPQGTSVFFRAEAPAGSAVAPDQTGILVTATTAIQPV